MPFIFCLIFFLSQSMFIIEAAIYENGYEYVPLYYACL